MKKKLVIIVFFFLGGVLSSYSEGIEPIPLTVEFDDPISSMPGQGKWSTDVPTITLDGYELSFQSSHSAYTLYIVENEVVVYSVAVSLNATSIILPSWLSGEYELQLYPDDCNYYFYGYIEL